MEAFHRITNDVARQCRLSSSYQVGTYAKEQEDERLLLQHCTISSITLIMADFKHCNGTVDLMKNVAKYSTYENGNTSRILEI